MDYESYMYNSWKSHVQKALKEKEKKNNTRTGNPDRPSQLL